MMPLLDRLLACNRNNLAWYKRHWKLSVHLCLAIGLAGFLMASWSARRSAPAQLAFAQAQSSPIACQQLGTPMRLGILTQGLIEQLHAHQYADLRMPLYGPNGQGVLFANAVKRNGIWQFTNLELVVAGRPGRLNLLPIQSTIPR